MKGKSLWLVVCIVLLLSLVTSAAAWAQAGQATLVIINFVGTPMTFTLDGTAYTVSGTDTAPDGGQLTLTLAPGKHTYSAHTPGSEGTNGDMELAAGQTQVLGARLQRLAAVVSPTGIVLEEPRDLLVLFEASLTPPAPAPAPVMAPLQPVPAGEGALVLVNYIGEELKIDIQGVVYTVPADNRLQVNLPPGQVSYSASAGLSGINGTALVKAGEYSGLSFTRETPPSEPDYDVGELEPTPVVLKIFVSPVSLDEAVVATRPAGPPAATPVTPAVAAPAGDGKLNVVNYIGEMLTLTIDDQVYSVAGGGGELTLTLSPGEYTYSASTPQAGSNGSLNVAAGATTRLSVTLDVQTGQMKTYIE